MKTTILVLILTMSAAASANTFVGNGGNAGDVEWLVTLKQIQAGVQSATDAPVEELCTCTDTYSNSSICDALNSLSQEQQNFCAASLKKQLPQLSPLVRDNRTVQATWTQDTIEVLENGQRRSVDAVTDRARGLMTLNAENFRRLNPSERVFLISHELLHLTSLDDKPLVDEGAVGPFTSADGSRKLINAMAASLVVEADRVDAFRQYKSTLNRPQGWKKTWLDLSFARVGTDPRSVYGVGTYSAMRARLDHYVRAVGFNLGYVQLRGDQKTLSQILSTEKSDTFQAGLNYRIFPFSDPLTYWGQSHLVLSADVDFISGEFNLRSTFNNDTVKSQRVGGSGEIRYYFPVLAGLWFSVAEAYESLPGAYVISGASGTPDTRIENSSNAFATYFGASYGF